MRIQVAEVVGSNAITLADGQRLHGIISEQLRNKSSIDLDFSGVEVFASPFFNASIGRLLAELTSAELNSLLHIHNLPKAGDRLLRQVIRNAKEYFSRQEI